MESKWQWKKRIAAYDFAILEVEMYLNTHPNDERALRLREMYRAKREELVCQFEKMFGTLVVTTDDIPCDADCWHWVNDPWPWDFEKEV